MKLCVSIFVFVNLFGSFECVTTEDIAACEDYQFGVTRCTSINFYYRECIVPGVDLIHAIKLNRSLSKELCEFKTTFGLRGNAVWVTSGCSGEFYICYDGEPMSTLHPPITVTSKTDPPTTTDDVHIQPESSTAGSTDVLIYVIVASSVVLLVGVGLIVGCVVKRRQQNDKSRHLAEKRQIRIELKEHRENLEENGVTMVPMANKSLSVESLNCIDSNNSSRNSCEYEKEGSVCSSRSSASTYLSSRTTGHLVRTRPSLHRMSSRMQFEKYGKIKRGISTPDISSLGRMYCDANISSKQQLMSSLKRHNRSSLIRCSQNSLESVREICNKYQVFDIPLENKLKQQARRPSKTNTVSFSDTAFRGPNMPRNGFDLRKFKTYETRSHTPDRLYRSLRSLPRESRHIIKAIVHSRSPSLKNISVTTVTKSATDDNTLVKEENVDNLQNSHPCSQGSSDIDHPSISVEKPETLPKETHESVPSKQFHYHDPSSLIRIPMETNVIEKPVDSFQSALTVKRPDPVYETVQRATKVKPKLAPKPIVRPNGEIYATVNKSYFKAVSKADRRDIAQGEAVYGLSLEDDEDDAVSMSSERENQYARLGKFRTTPVFSIPVPAIRIPGVPTTATKI